MPLWQYDSQLSAIGGALLDSAIGTGVGILQFVLSLVIAGIILGSYPNASKAGKLFFRKVIGQRGDELLDEEPASTDSGAT